jgi:hypothetical protein
MHCCSSSRSFLNTPQGLGSVHTTGTEDAAWDLRCSSKLACGLVCCLPVFLPSFLPAGLDIKTAAGMKLMKKDMGVAALVLALAHMVMSAQLPVKLRVLVPAVENAISGNAYR